MNIEKTITFKTLHLNLKKQLDALIDTYQLMLRYNCIFTCSIQSGAYKYY